MDEKISILVIDKEESFHSDIANTISQFSNIDSEVRYLSEIIVPELGNADYIIIDSRLVTNVKQFMQQASAAGAKRIIFVNESLNNPMSNAVIASGGSVFYRYSPMASLLHCIFGTFKPFSKSFLKDIISNYDGSSTRIVAVHSPSGGTGKTTICTNLAINLALKNKRVLVIDFSQYGCIGVKFRIKNRGTGLSGILSALEQNRENAQETDLGQIVRDNVFEYKNEMVKLDVIIAANPLKMEKATADDIEKIFMAIREMHYDVVIADTSCELSQQNLTILQMVDEILLVTIPDICCGWSLLHFKEIASNLGVSAKCKLVVNMYTKYSGFSCRELESELQYPLISVVPVYKELLLLNNQGICIGLKKKHQINAFVGRISDCLVPGEGRRKRSGKA